MSPGCRDEDVAFTATDGVRLAGVVRRPQGSGPFPAVLLLPGGAPVDRDGNPDPALALAHVRGVRVNVLRAVADVLAEVGIASFRYDKRGVGQSEGSFATRSATALIDDAVVAFRLLADRPEVPVVGVFGHSEGGMLAPQLVARGLPVAAIASCASTARGLPFVLEHQFAGAARRAAACGQDPAEVEASYERLMADVASGTDAVAFGVEGFESGRWIREWAAVDVSTALAAVTCPVLLVHGDKDWQVPWTEALHMHDVLLTAGNTDVTLALFSNVDHLLKFEPAWSSPQRYHASPNRPMVPMVASTLAAWFSRVLSGDPSSPSPDPWQGFGAGRGDFGAHAVGAPTVQVAV
jgi:hypothetical protein